ncbi:LPP20 family lipoprotein [Hydrocarboniclastica marina]|nr:LPP20 family lipoprotein [Hydrocarboniclastica marina]
MKPKIGLLTAMLLLSALAGCVFYVPGASGPSPHTQKSTDAEFERITVRESGFGTFADLSLRHDTRERLKARRASRLDAYRNLSERVYGSVIYGGSTVNDFVLENDRFRAYVDAYLRGARIIAVNEHSDGLIETVMELTLEPRFRDCLAQLSPRNVSLCSEPIPGLSGASGDVETRARANVDSLYFLGDR